MMSAMRLSVVALLLTLYPSSFLRGQTGEVRPPTLGHRSVPLITVAGLKFKDLNRNGKLDKFEDWRLSPEERADDLLRQLSIADMAGLMVHGTLPAIGGAEASIGRGSGLGLYLIQGDGGRVVGNLTEEEGDNASDPSWSWWLGE